ncbi:MAG: DUF5716 family protein [Treponema sp.]|nr:DUF5716 family protein [Treponema sp.]
MPENFFSLLSNINRQHYAALLVLYYRLFQENTHGIERELVVREFTSYLALHRGKLEEEIDIDTHADMYENNAGTEQTDQGMLELDFVKTNVPENEINVKHISKDERSFANYFLRRLINTGWLSEETLADFTRVINITAWGKPFLEALVRIDEGLKTEYESHIVNVYSSLCGETVKENGHFMVLKAHEEARALIDSLKVLSQSIKGYYDKLNAEAIRSKASLVLHEHYNLYAGDVLDRAYKRLKTSDNVSRYRQSIYKQITELLSNDEWLNASARKYMRILPEHRSEHRSGNNLDECRQKLRFMLEEIRDDLKTVDPLEDEIDRRNAEYSRYSTEIIRGYIEPDSTVAGKLGMIIKALYSGNDKLQNKIKHGLHRIQFLSPSSLSLRRPREEGDFAPILQTGDLEAAAKGIDEFQERMKKRLSIKRITSWLDKQGGSRRILFPKELIKDENSYIRFVYSLLYGDSRNDFGYTVEDKEKDEVSIADIDIDERAAGIRAGGYIVPDVRLRRKDEPRP